MTVTREGLGMVKVKKIILSGNRPTGKLHLGNYTGALENWVALQKDYKCFFMVADWHVLTTDYEHTSEIQQNTREMILDWIGAGLDPQRSTLFVQSHIKEHAELFLLFAMLITKPRLERNPTLKEQIRDLHLDQNISYGHLGYPVLQASDILIYRADLVPVGEDQLPHIEITREIARKFNQVYGNVFPVPDGQLTKFARFPGLDGKRMSKSLGLPTASRLIMKSNLPLSLPESVSVSNLTRPLIMSLATQSQTTSPHAVLLSPKAELSAPGMNSTIGSTENGRMAFYRWAPALLPQTK